MAYKLPKPHSCIIVRALNFWPRFQNSAWITRPKQSCNSYKFFLTQGYQSSHIFSSIQLFQNTVLTAEVTNCQDMVRLLSQTSHKFLYLMANFNMPDMEKMYILYEMNKALHTSPTFLTYTLRLFYLVWIYNTSHLDKTHLIKRTKSLLHTIPIFSLIILFACSIWSGDPRITNTFSAGFGGGLRSNSQCAPVCWLICLIVSPPARQYTKKALCNLA